MEKPQERLPEDSRPYGRRAFLGASALGLSSLFWGKTVWNAFSHAARPLENALPSGVFPGWRIYTVASTMPTFDAATWRLRIEGLVDRPQTLTYDDLRSLPRATQISDFHCVTGWSVDNVHWTGVRFGDLLAAAGPHASGTVLEFVSAESPYVDTLTLQQAMLHDAMLAYEMDGKPLAREHGAPVRVVIPEMYGYKNVKWVERIVVTDHVNPGYWEQRGYDIDAFVGSSNGF
jgi:DMSO/TMAO reductase YedYZ molybdopterin-dependent catalytic subunit